MEKIEKKREHLLEELSFVNLVETFRPELLRMLKGERATKVFTSSNRRTKLLRHGVFEEHYRHPGKTIILSQKAKMLLEEET